MTPAPTTEVEHQGARYHRPCEEELLLHHYPSGQSGLSPRHQEPKDEGIMTQGISRQKDSHSALFKKSKYMQKCSGNMWSVQLDAPRASLAPRSLTNTPNVGAVFGPHSGA